MLKRCVSFCEAAAQRQQYEQIAKMLSFIRTTNNDDDWLLSASQIILPRLKNIYAQILSGADPSRVESTKAMKVSISRTIQRDKYALRALSACFDVCVDFCDVVAEHTQEHLCVFLRTSAAVLFGSDFQRERDTLNETDYAMDELARSSSYALSNILITFPSIVSTAEAILGKRIRALCNCLCSSPELSIQKSLILILRVLYENGGDGSSKSLQSAIEKEISSSRLGSGVGLSLFKGIRYDDQDVVNQCERVLKKIFEKTPKEAICFKVESCSMQAKSGAHQVERRRVPFQTVSADWNKNTIITHDGKDVPQYWPIFSIMNFEWKKNRRELHLLHAAFGGREEMQMTIRFNLGGMGDAAKNVVGDRIRRIMELSMGQNESLDQSKPLEDRKVSVVSSKEDNRVEQEKISESSADVSGQTEHDESLQSGPKYGDTDGTIFSSIAADGVLVSKGSKESSFRSRNSGGESSSETFVHAPVHATSKKRRSEPSGDVPQPRKKRNVTDKDDHKVSSSPPPSRPVTVSSEEIAASSKQGRQASEMDRESSMKTAMQSSGACNTILKRDREQDYSPATQDCNGNSKIMNTRRPGRELQGGSSPKERIILKQANGRGNEQTLSLEPTVVHASRSDRQAQIPGPGLSKYPSVESLDHMNKEDERMKKKLQSIVRRVLKVSSFFPRSRNPQPYGGELPLTIVFFTSIFLSGKSSKGLASFKAQELG